METEHRGCKAEGNHIGQRIEFLADGPGDVHGTGCEAIEEVEHCSTKDEKTCQTDLSVQAEIDGQTAAEEVAASNYIG